MKIRTRFSIPRSGNVFVNDGVIETDGTTPEDFKHLTVEKMQEYLSSEMTDFNKLFDLVVAKVIEEIEGKTSIAPVLEETREVVINSNPKKNVKANKKVK